MHQTSNLKPKKIRISVSKLGLYGHDMDALDICRALRDAGMEVVYSGLFFTPEHIVITAIWEDVDVIAMSLLNAAHNYVSKSFVINDNNIDDIYWLEEGYSRIG